MLPKMLKSLYKSYVRLVCRCCSKIICQSQLAADELIKLFNVDPQKIEVVHNWIDVFRFSTVDEVRSRRNEDLVQIIFVGWMHEKKGVQFLIPAIKLLSESRQNFRLIMCGGGDLFDVLVKTCRDLDIERFVDFRGWVKNEEVNRLLNESDIFVLPSLAEGMPNSLLQAMACGLPVVTTNVSSIPAIVKDQVNGVLVQPGSPEEIYRGLITLIDNKDLRRTMSATNRKQIVENHDISNVWKRIAKILNVNLQT
jgi:glycosyltransferase involved in cell wall biosynthesis